MIPASAGHLPSLLNFHTQEKKFLLSSYQYFVFSSSYITNINVKLASGLCNNISLSLISMKSYNHGNPASLPHSEMLDSFDLPFLSPH